MDQSTRWESTGTQPQPARSPGAKFLRRLLALGAGIAAFLLIASVIEPYATNAEPAPVVPHIAGGGVGGTGQTVPAAAPHQMDKQEMEQLAAFFANRKHPQGWPVLGHLTGADYWVVIYGSPEGPRYTVCTLDGRTLREDMQAEDVYREFPTLDLEGMWLDPPGACPDDRALMLVDPTRQ